MALPTPTIYYHYLRLSREKFSTLPGFFSEDRKKQVDMLLLQLKQNYSVSDIPVSNKVDIKVETTPELSGASSEFSFFVNDKTNRYRH